MAKRAKSMTAKTTTSNATDKLETIRQSRATMLELRRRILERTYKAGSPEDVDKAQLELESAKIDLVKAELDLLDGATT
jgi:hypothetical protein